MSLARIDVQQLAPDRWVVELECGSYSRRRRTLLRGRNFAETMAAVDRAYREQTGEVVESGVSRETLQMISVPVEHPPLQQEVGGEAPSQVEHLPLQQEVGGEAPNQFGDLVSLSPPRLRPGFDRITEQQIAEAESLGLYVDRRWSTRRAQEAIDRKLAE